MSTRTSFVTIGLLTIFGACNCHPTHHHPDDGGTPTVGGMSSDGGMSSVGGMSSDGGSPAGPGGCTVDGWCWANQLPDENDRNALCG